MIYVVWGTGFVAKEYMNMQSKEICFFLDNDKNRTGKIFFGKEIIHPDEVDSWDGIHVIIAVNSHSANLIKAQLASYGLKEDQDYSMYYANLARNNFNYAEDEIDKVLSQIRQNVGWVGRTICFGSPFTAEDFITDYFAKWQSVLEDEKFLYILESGGKMTGEKISEDIPGIFIPRIFSEFTYPRNGEKCNIGKEILQFVMQNENLLSAAECFRKKHIDAQPLYEFGVIYFFYIFFVKVVKFIRPKRVVLWNGFASYHRVVKYVCMLENIPVILTEYGVLPGTFTFETMGEMGESILTIYAKEFLQLSVSKKEYEHAGEVWKYIRENNLNRKKQWKTEQLKEIEERLDKRKPTIFFAGQNDVAAGMCPYTDKSQKYHSPVFQSSVQAAIYLAEMAEQNDWNFIFKPHPYLQLTSEEIKRMPTNVIVVGDIGVNYLIDLADITVTIVSQTAYIALLHNKPVLLLGYIQLKDKGCTYQAFKEENIEEELSRAIMYGFTDDQKELFQRHIAQLLKYYLYDDYDTNRTYRYGKSFPANFSEIWQLEQRLKKMRGEKSNGDG